MKIAMIFTSKFHRSGITMVVMNYYRELIKDSEISIDFIVPNNIEKEFSDEIEKNGSKIFVIPMKVRKTLPLIYIHKLSKLLKENKYDIIHVHGSSSIMTLEMIAGKRAEIKTRIAHCHSTKSEHNILNKLLYKSFKENYTDSFACGEAAGRWLFKDESYYFIPNAQNIEKFKFNKDYRKKYRKKYNFDNKIVLGHVGNYIYAKNVEFIIETFDRLSKKSNDYILVLIGDGKGRKKIENLVTEKGLDEKIKFIDRTPLIHEWLNALDIMLLPSRYEGFPNVLIEWQISGLPCLVSNKVTKEVELTDLVKFVELNEDKWVKEILETKMYNCNREKNHENIKKISEKGFEIKNGAPKLKKIYKKIMLKNEGR